MPNSVSGDWHEYQRLVLAELERLNTVADKLDDKIVGLRADINDWKSEQKAELAIIKTKVAVYAAVVSVVVGASVAGIVSMLTGG